MRVAIVGAGLTGLTAAYRLSQKGHQVVIFEKEKKLGGLAGSFKQNNWAWPLEDFYHHLFPSDSHTLKLINELGLKKKLFFEKPKTSIFMNKNTSKVSFDSFEVNVSQFDSPLSLMKFPFLSFPQKIRTGLATIYLKLINRWFSLEKIKATVWLKKTYGEKAYQVLWEPLLKAKFGQFYNQIPASWFWARIKKRSIKLGYLEGGFQTLINKIVEEIKKNKGKIFTNHEINCLNDLNHFNKFDRIIFTTPIEVFLKIIKNTKNTSDGGRLNPPAGGEAMTPPRWKKMGKFKMLGAINLILVLKEKFFADGTYWLNINESGFPFVAVVEHTNFIDQSHYDNQTILYVGGYYPQNHRYFKMKKEDIFKEWLPYLQKINSDFNPLNITHYSLVINLYAQPIIPLNYSKIIPPYQTPLKNVFLACMQQVYPWDRGVNYAIELGEKITKLIKENEKV